MYSLHKNNYHTKPKSSTIYTPLEVSQFIYELLKDKGKIKKKEQIIIVDPCSGQGSLLAP
jgi:type I restriction-modification system DNA methylase subunit